ncbi:MAG: ABC transporter ATP-binding protein [Elusimicrobia bacterium]|nr:ABC transporter ATP-binding protein [Elusimicrobiota bacterium]
MSTLKVQSLSKSFGAVEAVADFSHDFKNGEITTVVGPSGSGKSTALWMIAGLTAPDRGTVILDGQDITAVPPEKRDLGLVFQSYALFPHLSVEQNVEFGLKVRKMAAEDRRRRVDEMLDLVRIGRLRERRINQLSGGEQQRVALARALAIRPKILLMDEPLSALDAKLREELRTELFRLLQDLRITTIYVTHDQIEAMSLGNELIVMNGGRIEQTGRPPEVYKKPANKFVAEFLGSANIFEAQCVEMNGKRKIKLPFTVIDAPAQSVPGSCWVMVRPEGLTVANEGEGHFRAVIESSQFLGNQIRIVLNVNGQRLIVDVHNDLTINGGTSVPVQIRSDQVFMWPR